MLNDVSVSFSRVKQAKKNVGVGGYVYVCVFAGDSMIGNWTAGKVTGKQSGCWSPEKGCYCSQFGELRGDKMLAGGHCELAIRMWGGVGGGGDVGVLRKTESQS